MRRGIVKQSGVAFIAVAFVTWSIAGAFGGTQHVVADTAPAAGAAAPGPTPTPTPTASPTPPACFSPESVDIDKRSLPVSATVCLKYRAGPDLGIPENSILKVLKKQRDANRAAASMPIQIDPVPDKDGLAIDFQLGTPAPQSARACGPAPTARMVNGVPLHDCEYRLAIVIQRVPETPKPWSPNQQLSTLRNDTELDKTRLVLEVNRVGACVETGSLLTDDLYKACKVTASPTPTPAPKPAASTSGAPSTAPSTAARAASETSAARIESDAPAGSDSPNADRRDNDAASPPVSASSAAPTPTPTPTPAPTILSGRVIAPWAALNEIFTRPVPPTLAASAVHWKNTDAEKAQLPVRGPVGYRICYVEGPEFPDDGNLRRVGQYRDLVVNPPAPGTEGRGCFDLVVVYREGTKGNYNYATGTKSGNASNDASSGSTAGTSNRFRAPSASGTGTAPAPSPSPQSQSRLTLTLAQPLNAFWQLSGEGNADNIALPALAKQTNSTLTSVVQQQLEQQFGPLAPTIGEATDQTAFNAVDADILQRLLPSAFRGYTEAGTLTKQPQAFDGTDVLGMQPFNASTIKVVTAGAKISSVNPLFNQLGQRLGIASIGWFHDASLGESGSIFHIDQDVSSHLSLGLSHTVGNSVTAPSNKYVAYPNPDRTKIDYPVDSPSPNPVLHSTNTVIGALLKFGNHDDAAQPFQIFTRAGWNGHGNDYTAAISGSNLGNGHVIKDDGTTLGLSALAGYRSIGATYAPLLTGYNPFAGNQIYFGRATIAKTTPKNPKDSNSLDDRSGTLPYTLTIAGVYAKNGGTREYGSFGVSPSVPLNANPTKTNWTFSTDGTFQRSYISTTVLTRQAGNFIYPQGPLNLLSNDQVTLTLQAQNPSSATDWTATVNAGLSLLHSPSCSGTALDPKCDSPYAHKITWGVNVSKQSLVLYANAAPGTQRLSSASVSSTIPSNNIQTTALIAFHVCSPGDSTRDRWGAEPSLSYKNNIAQDGSAFQPGSLFEAGIDIGPSNGINLGILGKSVLSVTYQNAVNTHGTPVALANHGFGISLISASQAIWNAHKTKTDNCLPKSSDTQNGGNNTTKS